MKNRGKQLIRLLFHLQFFLWSGIDSSFCANQWITPGNIRVEEGQLSPDGKLLLYVRDNSGKKELWLKYLSDSGEGIQLKKVSANAESPTFSPDSKTIAYSIKQNGYSRIYTMSLGKNSEPQPISRGAWNEYHPVFSPDGNEIAFDSDESGNFDIWTYNMGSGHKTQLTHWRNHDFSPSYSPDGKAIAYTSFRNGSFNIFLKNLVIQQSLPVQLTEEETTCAHPFFASGGTGIFYDSNRSGKNQIYYFDLQSYTAWQVTDEKGECSHPNTAADTLIYRCQDQGVSGLYSRAISANWKSEYKQVLNAKHQEAKQIVSTLKQRQTLQDEIDRARAANAELKPVHPPEVSLKAPDFDLSFLERQEEPANDGIIAGAIKPESVALRTPAPRQQATPQPALQSESISSDQVTELMNEADNYAKRLDASDPLREMFEPKLPSFVKATVPENRSAAVPVYSPISIILNRELYSNETAMLEPKLYEGDKPVPCKATYTKEIGRLDVIPMSPLEPGSQYRVVAGNVSFGFKTDGIAKADRNRNVQPSKNTQAPVAVAANPDFVIERVFPVPGTKQVHINAPIRIRFNDRIDPSSINAGTVQLYLDDVLVPGELTFENNDRELSLKPYRNLSEASVYQVRVSKDLKSTAGNSLIKRNSWKFKTRYLSPFLITEHPKTVLDNPYGKIQIEFNRPVSQESIQQDEFFLQGKSFQYKGQVQLSPDKTTLTFQSYHKLPDQQDFTFYMSPSLKDEDGNLLENAKPTQIASRFMSDGHDTGKMMARARSMYPTTNKPEQRQGDIQVLEDFIQRGYIKNKSAREYLKMENEINRYKIALLIEEAIDNVQRMNKKDRQGLLALMNQYDNELKNIGIDIQNVKLQIEPRTSYRNTEESNSFTGRGRRL